MFQALENALLKTPMHLWNVVITADIFFVFLRSIKCTWRINLLLKLILLAMEEKKRNNPHFLAAHVHRTHKRIENRRQKAMDVMYNQDS